MIIKNKKNENRNKLYFRIHSKMFAVVKNSENQFYSIRSAWLKKNDDDGKFYAFYPAESKMQKYLDKGIDVKSSWKSQEVEVQLDNIEGNTKFLIFCTNSLYNIIFLFSSTDLTEAEAFIQKKIQYVDSEASELDKKMKSKKRKLVTTDSFHDEDFNAEFDAETSFENLQETFGKVVSHLYFLAILAF